MSAPARKSAPASGSSGDSGPTYGTKTHPIVYRLEVNEDTETVRIFMSPPRYVLAEGQWVKFESNVANAAIRASSPISPFYNYEDKPPHGHPAPGEVFELGKKGRICQVLCSKGMSSFECGYVEDGAFETWPNSEGFDIPGGTY